MGAFLGLLTLRLIFGGPSSFPNDDAYISQHSAHYLTESADPSYPGARPMTGATSLLHVLVLWVVMLVSAPSVAVEVVTWLGAFAYVLGSATVIWERVSAGLERGVILLIAVLAGSAPLHLANGQETGWAMAAGIWAIHWLRSDAPHRRRVPLLAGLLPWIRPDLAALSLLLWIGRTRYGRAVAARDLLILTSGLLGGLTLYFALSGALIPSTILAKRAFFAEYVRPYVTNIADATIIVSRWALMCGPSTLGLLFATRIVGDRIVFVAGSAVVAAIALAGPGTLEHNYFRYLQPLGMPLLVAGLCQAPLLIRPSLFAASVVWAVAVSPVTYRSWKLSQDLHVGGQEAIAAWLGTHAPTGTSVIVHDAGFLSEHSRMRLVDLVGLKTPFAAATHEVLTGPSAGEGRSEAIHRIACAGNPHYLVAIDVWDQRFRLTDGLRGWGWGVSQVFRSVAREGHRETGYGLFRLTRSPKCPLPPRASANQLLDRDSRISKVTAHSTSPAVHSHLNGRAMASQLIPRKMVPVHQPVRGATSVNAGPAMKRS
jgi:hypothetical protein